MGRAELLRYWIEDRTCVVCPWHEDCLEAVCMFQPLICGSLLIIYYTMTHYAYALDAHGPLLTIREELE
jgi:hypothetical protein